MSAEQTGLVFLGDDESELEGVVSGDRPEDGWILGLDVATTTGWAKVHPTGRYEWGHESFAPEDKDEPEGVRFLRCAEWIASGILEDVAAVVIEQTFSQRFRTAQILYGLAAVVIVELERHGIEYAFVPAATLKKHATDDGHAKKSKMREHLEKRIPHFAGRELTGDESDAVWCCLYGLDNWTGGEGLWQP